MESSAGFASLARSYGWKLYAHQDPEKSPVRLWDGWYLLDDEFRKVKTDEPDFD
jgi:hypothetical protein